MAAKMHRSARVAAAQLAAFPMAQADRALAGVEAAIREAAAAGAELLVLPECAYPAYAIGSPAAYRRGNHMKHAAFLEQLCGWAAEHKLHVVCGFVEDAGERLFNAAAVVSPDGRIRGVAHKSLMWMMDTRWFAPAEKIEPIDTDIGRIGVTICADNRVPEITATLAAKGAEIICVPTCWLDAASDGEAARNPQPEFMIPARSREFGLPHVCADKVGREGTRFGYVGMSIITDRAGNVVAMADDKSETLITATVDIGPAREMPPGCRKVLFSVTKSFPVPAKSKTTIAMATGTLLRHVATLGQTEQLFHTMRDSGVIDAIFFGYKLASVTFSQAVEDQAGIRIHVPTIGRPDDLLSIRMGESFEISARLPASTADTHVLPRALSIVGFPLLLFEASHVNIGTLRTRAIENHVYVAVLGDDEAILIGPDAEIIDHVKGEARPLIAKIDLAKAADKQVAPLTDIFEQRRPELYAF